jgi:hypothetical protein
VNGKNRTTFERMMELDVTYCETKSLFLDLKILISTPFAILRQVWDVRASRRAAAQVSSENTGLITRLNHGGGQRAPAMAETGHEIARGAVLATAHRSSLRAAPGTTEV